MVSYKNRHSSPMFDFKMLKSPYKDFKAHQKQIMTVVNIFKV